MTTAEQPRRYDTFRAYCAEMDDTDLRAMWEHVTRQQYAELAKNIATDARYAEVTIVGAEMARRFNF